MADINTRTGCVVRQRMFEIWLEGIGKDKDKYLKRALRAQLISKAYNENIIANAIIIINKFCSQLSKRWTSAYRVKSRFVKNNQIWLNSELKIIFSDSLPSTSTGRPQISFDSCSERSKRRKTKDMRNEATTNELVYAAQMSLRNSGRPVAAKLITEITQTSPTRALKIRKAWVDKEKFTPKSLSPDEALALVVDTDLTKSQYLKIRTQSKLQCADIYPNYKKIRTAKELCYPDKKSILISETFVEIELQALLDHTVTRIIQSQEKVFNEFDFSKFKFKEFVLISKWGCDGSTGHSEYKQKLTEGKSDADMFVISLVPLQLYSMVNTKKYIFWQNPTPSSVRYCRPIKIEFSKETAELARTETNNILAQIENLELTLVRFSGRYLPVKHRLQLTMVDGKICNSITYTSSAQKCYICGATPTQMNQMLLVKDRTVDQSTFQFGLSTLHAWIRFFECFLHISYRLDFKTWQVRNQKDKDLLKKRKTKIQKQFREELGLIVDQVRPGGSGTSNDGNTARIFFKNCIISSRITGINEILLSRSANILQALSSGFEIDVIAFEEYAKETAKLYIKEYNWYYMPASVHKILIHGSQIISNALLPIGQLSEEAQESRNKDLKKYRRTHTRKISRAKTNEDLIHILLVSSDPWISSLRKVCQKRRRAVPKEVLQLLKAPECSLSNQDTEMYSSSEDSSGEEES